MNNLDKIRNQIDQTDQEILKLIEHRFLLNKEVAKIKATSDFPVYDEKREQNIFKKLSKQSFLENKTKHVFNEIISLCRTNQSILEVVCLEKEYTISMIAIKKIFGHFVKIKEINSLNTDNCPSYLIIALDSKSIKDYCFFLFHQKTYNCCIIYTIENLSQKFIFLSNKINIDDCTQTIYLTEDKIITDLNSIEKSSKYKELKCFYATY